jgi:hypothetical protein
MPDAKSPTPAPRRRLAKRLFLVLAGLVVLWLIEERLEVGVIKSN